MERNYISHINSKKEYDDDMTWHSQSLQKQIIILYPAGWKHNWGWTTSKLSEARSSHHPAGQQVDAESGNCKDKHTQRLAELCKKVLLLYASGFYKLSDIWFGFVTVKRNKHNNNSMFLKSLVCEAQLSSNFDKLFDPT